MSVRLISRAESLSFSVRLRLPKAVIDAFLIPLAIFLGTRVAFYMLALASYVLVPWNPRDATPFVTSSGVLIEAMTRGDARGYLELASDGYWFDPVSRLGSALLSPLYPLLIRALGFLGSPDLVAVLLSNLAFAAALVALHRLVAERRDPTTATRACLLLGVAPFAFLYAAASPWSLVLLFAALAFLAEERRQPWLAGVAATLAALSDPFGLAVWPALVVGRAYRAIARRDENVTLSFRLGSVLSLGLTPLAVAGFAVRLRRDLGFPWSKVSEVLLGFPLPFLPPKLALTAAAPGASLLLGLNLVLALLVLLTIPRVARSLGVGYAAFAAALLILAIPDPMKLGSATLLAFPSLIAVAELLGSDLTEAAGIGLSSLALAFLTAAYVTAWPVVPTSNIGKVLSNSDWILVNFHIRFQHQDANRPQPRDELLTLDNALLVLADDPPAARYAPGGTISLQYYLYTLRSTDRGYLISARLHDSKGKEVARADKTLWGNADAPLFAESTTASLKAGNYLREGLSLPLGPNVPLGAYTLDVLVFRIPSFDRLSLTDANGGVVDELVQAPLVVAKPDDLGTEATLKPARPLRADLGATLSLLGYDASRTPDQKLRVSLYWVARAVPDANYTVFVQALDESGKVVAQSDSYPAAGGFPTTRMTPGQVLRDVHDLTLPPGQKGPLRLIAGMYQIKTMQRLPVRTAGAAVPDDHISLGTIPDAGDGQ